MSSRRIIIQSYLAIVCLPVFLLSGCGRQNTESPQTHSVRPSLLIGLVPEQSMFKQVERYDPVVRYISERTGFDVKTIVLPRYENILSSFTSEKMDAAFFGSFVYILAHEKLGVQALVRPEGLNGLSTYRGFIFVRRDSHIRSIHDMRGKRFAFVSKDTTAGYLLPLAYFKKAGVNYKTYLKETYFTGTHEDAIYDVLDRKADIGAAKNTEFERLAAENPRIRKELAVLAISPEMPENSLAVRKDIDPIVREKLENTLLDMDQDPEGWKILRKFGAVRFIETRNADFKSVYDYIRTIGLNIKTGRDFSLR